jgi:hypothetical protein
MPSCEPKGSTKGSFNFKRLVCNKLKVFHKNDFSHKFFKARIIVESARLDLTKPASLDGKQQ